MAFVSPRITTRKQPQTTNIACVCSCCMCASSIWKSFEVFNIFNTKIYVYAWGLLAVFYAIFHLLYSLNIHIFHFNVHYMMVLYKEWVGVPVLLQLHLQIRIRCHFHIVHNIYLYVIKCWLGVQAREWKPVRFSICEYAQEMKNLFVHWITIKNSTFICNWHAHQHNCAGVHLMKLTFLL